MNLEANHWNQEETDPLNHEIETYHFGDITVSASPTRFSNPINNDDLIKKVIEMEAHLHQFSPDDPASTTWMTAVGIPEFQQKTYLTGLKTYHDLIRQIGTSIIDSVGIPIRYQGPTETDLTPDQLVDHSAKISARILDTMLEERGWDGVDMIFDSSAILDDTLGQQIISYSTKLRNKNTQTYTIRNFCAGTVSAKVLAMKWGLERAAILIAEPISYRFHPLLYTLRKMATAALFGDEYGGILFQPNKHKLYEGQIKVIPDDGVIKLETMYDEHIPPHEPNSMNQLNPSSPNQEPFIDLSSPGALKISSFNQKGFYTKTLPLPEAESELGLKVDMDGAKTVSWFKDLIANNLFSLLTRAQKNYDLNPNAINIIYHEASKSAWHHSLKTLKKLYQKDGLDLPLLLPKEFKTATIPGSNSSSGTYLRLLHHLAKNKLFNPGNPYIIGAPGIGSTISSALVRDTTT